MDISIEKELTDFVDCAPQSHEKEGSETHDVKIEDTCEQFIDENGIHDRIAWMIKSESDSLNILSQSTDKKFVIGTSRQEVEIGYKHIKSHVDAVHLNSRQYKCSLCDYDSNYKKDLRNHVNSSHLNLKQYKCHRCEFVAYRKRSLKVHVNDVHLNLRDYKCSFCDFASNYKDNLKSHIESIHLNFKKFKCNTCDFATHRSVCLKSHIECVHLNLKQHKCFYCD